MGRPGFRNARDYGKIGGGMLLLAGGAAFGARLGYLAYEGVQAARYGSAGLTVYAAQHGQEISETLEGAALPIGHPSVTSPIQLAKEQFGAAGAGLEGIAGTITNREGVAVIEDFAIGGINVNWRGVFKTLDEQLRRTGATSIRMEGSILGPLGKIEKVLDWAGKNFGYKVTRTDPSGGYPQYLLEKNL